jgi:endonuclease YncB( thermonuclease family)
VTRPLPPRFTYQLDTATAVDGDTVRAHLTRHIPLTESLTATIHTTDHPIALRLLWVDTPERNNPDGWRRARTDTTTWLAAHAGNLTVETHGHDNFGRQLADIYITGDRTNTLSQWLIIERGWLPYEERP